MPRPKVLMRTIQTNISLGAATEHNFDNDLVKFSSFAATSNLSLRRKFDDGLITSLGFQKWDKFTVDSLMLVSANFLESAARGHSFETFAKRQNKQLPVQVDKNFAIQFFSDEAFVVEQSPPSLESILHLSEKASSSGGIILIGSYVGISTSQGSSMLMLIAVPTSIVLIGAAAGVGSALRRGLQKKIEGVFGIEAAAKTSD